MAKTNAPTIETLWKEIDAWLKKNAKVAHASLQKGASKAALTKLEQALGVKVPADLAAWLSIHDGQAPDSGITVVGNWDLLSCDRIADAHAALQRQEQKGILGESKDGLVKPVWWNPKWIPFMESPAGDFHCVDLDPTLKGEAGQIVTWFHDAEFRNRKAESLTAYFAEYLSDLRSEYYELEENGSLRLQ